MMRKMLGSSCLAVGLMTSLTAFAEEGVEALVTDSSRVYDIEEVVVVSQPKEFFRLRQQPVASTSLQGGQLQMLGIHDLRQLSDHVPSFTMPQYGSRYTSSMYIRGIGSRVNSPSVGLYVDGMPLLNKASFNFHLYDVDRVDVLRGPQGTLYGMNTEGGLVRMYSRNPLLTPGTEVRLSVGSGWTRQAEVAHHQRVGDKLGLTLAGFYNGQRGFFRNQYSGERADEQNEGGGKLRLLYQPTRRLQLGVVADYQYVRQNGFPYGLLDLATKKTEQPNTNRQGNYRRNLLHTGFDLSYHADAFSVSSVTSYQYLRDYMLMDIDYLPADYMHLEQRQRQNALTEELTVKSQDRGLWRWTVGAFFSHMNLSTIAPVYFDPEMNAFLSQQITDYAYYGMLNSMAARMGETAAAALIARMGGCQIDMSMQTIPGFFRTPQTNLALFHESHFVLTDRLTATLGLRYDLTRTAIDYWTRGDVVLSEDVMGQHVDAQVVSLLQHKDHNIYRQLLPKAGLLYRYDRSGSNVYATVSKGYRAGGFNMQMFSDILQTELQGSAQQARGQMELPHDEIDYANIAHTISYKPETSWNFELGTHANLFDGALQADLGAYYIQVRNQQLSVMAGNYGFGRMMVNAGKSYSCGIEASLRGSAFDDRLSWTASYGYTHAVFKEYTDSVKVGGVNTAVSYRDKRVPFVPVHTFSASADYRFATPQCSALQAVVVGANVQAQGRTYWDEANSYQQHFYATLGMHADAQFRHLTVGFWLRNLDNVHYNTFAVQSAATGQLFTFAQLGNPVQAGVDIRLHF